MKSIKNILSVLLLIFPFFLMSCGDDQEISPGHFKGPRGGTYTISSSGTKEYYGNSSGTTNSNIPIWLIVIIILIVFVFIIGCIIFASHSYATRELYKDPLNQCVTCKEYNCSNKFYYVGNRKYCQDHSSSPAKVNISKTTIDLMKVKEEEMSDKIGESHKLISVSLRNQGLYWKGKGSFFAYLKSKNLLEIKNDSICISGVNKSYEEIKIKYFNKFIKDKYY